MAFIEVTARDIGPTLTLAEIERQRRERLARRGAVPNATRVVIPPKPPSPPWLTIDFGYDVGSAHIDTYHRHFIEFEGWDTQTLQILAEVVWKYCFSAEYILGPKHLSAYMPARRELYARLRTECSLSLPAIGRLVRRDHQTVAASIMSYRAHARERSKFTARRQIMSGPEYRV